MSAIKKLLNSWHGEKKEIKKLRPSAQGTRFQPSLLSLEDRAVPSAVTSTINCNFNGTAIAAGDDIWFSSVAKVQGVHNSPVNIWVSNQTITFTANGTTYTVDAPNTILTLTPGATTATTTYVSGVDAWDINVPAQFSGNTFLGGAVFQAVNGLPGGIKNVQWQGSYSTDTAGISVNWQWAGAVYTNFSTNLNTINPKAVDDNHFGPYANSDHAGTPESYKAFVTGGATGGGGSNWTGSYSSTATVNPPVGSNPFGNQNSSTTSLSGTVFYDANCTGSYCSGDSGISGWTVTLTGTDSSGNSVMLTTATDGNGNYTFSGLSAGTYSLSVQTAPSYVSENASAGTVNGNTDGVGQTGSISQIVLQTGDQGINYNFAELILD